MQFRFRSDDKHKSETQLAAATVTAPTKSTIDLEMEEELGIGLKRIHDSTRKTAIQKAPVVSCHNFDIMALHNMQSSNVIHLLPAKGMKGYS